LIVDGKGEVQVYFRGKVRNKWGIYDKDGNRLGGEFGEVRSPQLIVDGKGEVQVYFRGKVRNKWGIYDKDGNRLGGEFGEVWSPQLIVDGKGEVQVYFVGLVGDTLGIYDRAGKRLSGKFSQNTYGQFIVDVKGEVQVYFSGKVGDKWGIYDKDGNRIGGEFDHLNGSPTMIIDGKGEAQAYYLGRVGDKIGIYDKAGNRLGGEFNEVDDPKLIVDGRGEVQVYFKGRVGTKWGIYDKTGSLVTGYTLALQSLFNVMVQENRAEEKKKTAEVSPRTEDEARQTIEPSPIIKTAATQLVRRREKTPNTAYSVYKKDGKYYLWSSYGETTEILKDLDAGIEVKQISFAMALDGKGEVQVYFIGKKDEKWGLYDKTGRSLAEGFDDWAVPRLKVDGKGDVQVYFSGKKGEKWGIYDKTGRPLAEGFEYISDPELIADNQGEVQVYFSGNKAGKWGLYDKAGRPLAEGFDAVSSFSPQLIVDGGGEVQVYFSGDKAGKWGLYDKTGRPLVEGFRDMWGPELIVDGQGEVQIYFWGKKDAGWGVFDKTGRPLAQEFENVWSLVPVVDGQGEVQVYFVGNKAGRWGVYDKTGRSLANGFDSAWIPPLIADGQGKIQVRFVGEKNMKFGIYSKSGRPIAEGFDDLEDLRLIADGERKVQAYFSGQKDGKTGIYDLKGNTAANDVTVMGLDGFFKEQGPSVEHTAKGATPQKGDRSKTKPAAEKADREIGDQEKGTVQDGSETGLSARITVLEPSARERQVEAFAKIAKRLSEEGMKGSPRQLGFDMHPVAGSFKRSEGYSDEDRAQIDLLLRLFRFKEEGNRLVFDAERSFAPKISAYRNYIDLLISAFRTVNLDFGDERQIRTNAQILRLSQAFRLADDRIDRDAAVKLFQLVFGSRNSALAVKAALFPPEEVPQNANLSRTEVEPQDSGDTPEDLSATTGLANAVDSAGERADVGGGVLIGDEGADIFSDLRRDEDESRTMRTPLLKASMTEMMSEFIPLAQNNESVIRLGGIAETVNGQFGELSGYFSQYEEFMDRIDSKTQLRKGDLIWVAKGKGELQVVLKGGKGNFEAVRMVPGMKKVEKVKPDWNLQYYRLNWRKAAKTMIDRQQATVAKLEQRLYGEDFSFENRGPGSLQDPIDRPSIVYPAGLKDFRDYLRLRNAAGQKEDLLGEAAQIAALVRFESTYRDDEGRVPRLREENVRDIVVFLLEARGLPVDPVSLRWGVSRIAAQVGAARPEYNQGRSEMRDADLGELTMAETNRVLAEVGWARERNFLNVILPSGAEQNAIQTFLAKAKTGLSPENQALFEQFSGEIQIVNDPVKKRDDNMWTRLEVEGMVYSWSPDGIREGEVGLGEVTFNVNGKRVLAVRERAEDGEFKLLIRESFYQSVMAAILAGDARGPAILSAMILDQAGQNLAKPADTAVRAKLAENVSGLIESVRYAAAQSLRLVTDEQAVVLTATDKPLNLVISADVIAQNYGIRRTIQALVSVGHRIVIWENSKFSDSKYREEFYRAYHLDDLLSDKDLLERHLIKTVRGTEGEVKPAIGAVAVDNTIVVAFARENLGVSGASRLVLKDDLLGLDEKHRADFPVALLAARLREDPDRIQKLLGADTLKQTSKELNTWELEQTPEGGEFTQMLAQEFQNYRKAAEKIAAAA
jgi:hypothetical protein